MPAQQAPGRVVDPVDAGLVVDAGQCHHLGLRAQAATELARTRRAFAQLVVLDQQGELVLHLLAGAVVGVAVVHAHGHVDAVFVVFGAPAAANQAAQVNPQLAVARVDAVDVGNDQIGMVASNGFLGDGLGHGLEDGVDHGHGVGHPHPHGRRVQGADHGAGGQDHLERAKVAIVDRVVTGHGQAFESHLGTSHPRTRVEKAFHLGAHATQVDGHFVIADGDLDPDGHGLVDVHRIVVHEGLGLVDAIGHGANLVAGLGFGVVHDGVNRPLPSRFAVACQHLFQVLHPHSAGR